MSKDATSCKTGYDPSLHFAIESKDPDLAVSALLSQLETAKAEIAELNHRLIDRTDGFLKRQQEDADLIRRLKAMLRRLEWLSDFDDRYGCPCCDCYEGHGHSEDCELAKLIA